MQERLRKKLKGRTQGPSESISTYLCKVRDLLDQLKPSLTLHEQLDRVYQKLHHSYRMRFDRKDFETFPELQKLGKKEELRRAQDRAYKPPPSLAESSFPSSAYVPIKPPRPGKVARNYRDVVSNYAADGNSSHVFATTPCSSTTKRKGSKVSTEEAF